MSEDYTVIGLVTYKGAVAGLEIQDVTYGESGSTIAPLTEDGRIDRISIYGKKKTIAVNGNVKEGADMGIVVDPDVDSEKVWSNKVDLCPDSCYIDSVPVGGVANA